jgi:hypothetical protein
VITVNWLTYHNKNVKQQKKKSVNKNSAAKSRTENTLKSSRDLRKKNLVVFEIKKFQLFLQRDVLVNLLRNEKNISS